MARQNDLCIVARIRGETWYILITFDPALPGEIDGIRSTTDNPGRKTISLRGFRKLLEVSESAKKVVNNEVKRIGRKKAKEQPIVKSSLGIKLLEKYSVPHKLVQVVKTKIKAK